MEEEQNNYFSSTIIFKIIIAHPPTSLLDLEAYLATLSCREVEYFKNGANVDFLAPDFFKLLKSGASKLTLAPFLKQIGDIISFISPLSHKRALSPFFEDRGDEYLKIIFNICFYKLEFSIRWNFL